MSRSEECMSRKEILRRTLALKALNYIELQGLDLSYLHKQQAVNFISDNTKDILEAFIHRLISELSVRLARKSVDLPSSFIRREIEDWLDPFHTEEEDSPPFRSRRDHHSYKPLRQKKSP